MLPVLHHIGQSGALATFLLRDMSPAVNSQKGAPDSQHISLLTDGFERDVAARCGAGCHCTALQQWGHCYSTVITGS
jgi:hypothetical protein